MILEICAYQSLLSLRCVSLLHSLLALRSDVEFGDQKPVHLLQHHSLCVLEIISAVVPKIKQNRGPAWCQANIGLEHDIEHVQDGGRLEG